MWLFVFLVGASLRLGGSQRAPFFVAAEFCSVVRLRGARRTGRMRLADSSSLGLRWRRRLWGCGRLSAGRIVASFWVWGICRGRLHHLLAAVAPVGCASAGGVSMAVSGGGFYGVLVESACFSSCSVFSSSSPHLTRPLSVSTCLATSAVSLLISVIASSRVVYLELAMSGSGPWYW